MADIESAISRRLRKAMNEMSKAANQAKTRWNAEHYTQIKVYVDPDVAYAFKRKCQSGGASMSSVLSQFMADYGKADVKRKPPPAEDGSTKKKRRKLIDHATRLVEIALDGEECARDNTPENLQSTDRYTESEESISKMGEIIDLLFEVY